MGFLNFLKKEKREDVKDDSLEIPLPPTMADDMGEISDLPNLSDDSDQSIPLPPLEPMDVVDKKYFEDFKMPQNDSKQMPKADFKQTPNDFKLPKSDFKNSNDYKSPQSDFKPAQKNSGLRGFDSPQFVPPLQKGFDGFKGPEFNQFPKQAKDDPFSDIPFDKPQFNPFKEEVRRAKDLPDKKPAHIHKHKFVRAEHFGTMVGNIEDVKSSVELNKSLVSVKKLLASSDKEYDRLHKSLEDIQRNLFYVDQELFEER